MRRAGPRIAYVSADRGVPVAGTKGGSTHIRELVHALVGRGAGVRIVTARPGEEGQTVPVAAPVLGVAADRLTRALRNEVRAAAPGKTGETIGNEALALLLNAEMHRRLQQLDARWRVQAVYERYSLWGLSGLRFARERNLPFLLEVNAPLRIEQAQWRELHNDVLATAIEALLFQVADRVVVPSRALRDYVISRGGRPGRVKVMANAADTTRLHPAARRQAVREPGTYVVGFVGGLKPWHGLDDLLRAFVRLYRRDRSYRLLIVGDGPQRKAIESICRRERLGDAVRITGFVDPAQVAAHLAAMDVATAPYPRLSGFYFSPLKLFEYMAAGVPIVASAIGQVAELLRDGETALLHRPSSVAGLARRIAALRAEPRLATKLARAARRRVGRRHTWDRNAARVLAELAAVQRRKAPHGR